MQDVCKLPKPGRTIVPLRSLFAVKFICSYSKGERLETTLNPVFISYLPVRFALGHSHGFGADREAARSRAQGLFALRWRQGILEGALSQRQFRDAGRTRGRKPGMRSRGMTSQRDRIGRSESSAS